MAMNTARTSRICPVAVSLLVLALMSGCAVLTRSQIGEVNKFANAAKDYSELPGAVMKAHAEIRMKKELLYVTTFKDGRNALREIEQIVAFKEDIARKSEEADQALDVLKSYPDLLVKLTSDDYTNNLQGSAENLGGEIDNGIKSYNKITGANLTAFGSIVAATVRGVGGIYIKREQAEALRKAVINADPVINRMIGSVENLLFLYLNENDRKELVIGIGSNPKEDDLIRNEIKDLKDTYEKDIVPRYDGRQPLEVVSFIATEIVAANDEIQLARNAVTAAEAYRKAHSKLAESLKRKEDIKGMIEEIQVLAGEVKSAQALKKKLDQR